MFNQCVCPRLEYRYCLVCRCFCIVTNVQNIVGLLGFVTFITITSYARLQALSQKQVFVRVCTL